MRMRTNGFSQDYGLEIAHCSYERMHLRLESRLVFHPRPKPIQRTTVVPRTRIHLSSNKYALFPLRLNAGRKTSVQGIRRTCECNSRHNECTCLRALGLVYADEVAGMLDIIKGVRLPFAVLGIDMSTDGPLPVITDHSASRGCLTPARLVYNDHVGERDWGTLNALLTQLDTPGLSIWSFPRFGACPSPDLSPLRT